MIQDFVKLKSVFSQRRSNILPWRAHVREHAEYQLPRDPWWWSQRLTNEKKGRRESLKTLSSESNLSELSSFDFDERGISQLSHSGVSPEDRRWEANEPASDFSLPYTSGPHHKYIFWNDFLSKILRDMLSAPSVSYKITNANTKVLSTHRDCNSLLRGVLSNNEFIKTLLNLARLKRIEIYDQRMNWTQNHYCVLSPSQSLILVLLPQAQQRRQCCQQLRDDVVL